MLTAKITWTQVEAILFPILKAILIVVIGHFLIKYLLKIMDRSLKRGKMDISLNKFLIKSVNITLHAIILLSALNAIGISTTGLLAALSAAAVGIALALKDSLSNIAGGILLLVSPRFSTGDYIDVAGKGGTVMQVDLMHTTLKSVDNSHIVIPNGVLINSQLTNYSREEKRRVDLKFSISYDNDAEKAKQIILETIKAHPLVINEPDVPFVRVGEYASSSVDIITRTWCKASDYWALYFDLLEQVRAAFDKNGISIPYDQLDVHVSNS